MLSLCKRMEEEEAVADVVVVEVEVITLVCALIIMLDRQSLGMTVRHTMVLLVMHAEVKDYMLQNAQILVL